MRKRVRQGLAAIFMAFVLVFGVGAVNSTPAQAGECHAPAINLCGKIKNTGNYPLRLIQGWPNVYGIHLPPGASSQTYYRDTDGFYVYPGYRAWVCAGGGYCAWAYPGAHKITDNLSTYSIRLERY